MTHDEPTNQSDDADDTPPEVATQLVEEATTHLPYHNTTATLVQDLTIAPLRAYLNGGSNAPHPADAMIRAYLLKEIRGIPHKSELVEYLEENEKTAHRFGFDTGDLPTRTQCSRWWNHYFSPELCAIINHSAKAIREEAYESGNPLDADALEPDDTQNASQRTKKRIKDEKTDEVTAEMRNRYYPLLYLKRRGWCKYDEEDFFDLLVHMGQEQDFANNGSETLAKNRDKEYVPDGDTLRHHIRKFWIHELRELNDELSTVMYESADEMGLFDDRLNLAIDESPWRFYGDTDTYGVGDVDHARGTSYAYKLLTICIVGDDGERFTLDWTIVTGREETREVIGELVETASKWCDIKNIFLDRGFYGVLMIKALQATGENFMMRAPKSPKRTRLLNEHGSDIVVEEDDEMARSRPPYEKTTINRIIVPARESAKDDYIEFVTNRTVTEESAVTLARTYEQRWGVETSYRKIKQFLPKTTSTHYSLRLFYLLFAILLYNTWIMVNSIVRESLGIPRDESPPVTRGMFATVLIGLREGIT